MPDPMSAIAPYAASAPSVPKLAAMPTETAQAFEAMILRPMVEAMVPHGGAMGEGTGSDAWRGMMVDALADEMARTGTLGLGSFLPSAMGR